MLTTLKITNIALIPEVEINFGKNLNILSGETGAGKSIILGSLNFILGDKIGKDMIRDGASHARVDAVFQISDAKTQIVADIIGGEIDENTVIISRTIKQDGKTECRINGTIVTAKNLRDITNNFIHIHGQHETESILKRVNHVNILDEFALKLSKEFSLQFTEYQNTYRKLKDLEKHLKSFGGNDEERGRTIDIYQFQINEIQSADLQENEDIELQEKKQRMQNFEKISGNLTQALAYLSSDEGACSLLKSAIGSLSSVANIDSELESLYDEAISSSHILSDIESTIQSYLDRLEFDEEEFNNVDARLDQIKSLKRKYGVDISEILKFLETTIKSLNTLVNSEQEIEDVKKQITETTSQLLTQGETLSATRQKIALDLEQTIIKQLQPLGMPSCQFKVQFANMPTYNSIGIDDIEFLFSANCGESLKPMSNIISGGEMSRFMLGLKTAMYGIQETKTNDGNNDNAAITLVFDEIDTGIGGTMGLEIAKKIATLSRRSQIICVTHLSQIAAMADTHFLIKKIEYDNRTTTNVYKLDDEGKEQELARMIGGLDSTNSSAKQMQTWANQYKNS